MTIFAKKVFNAVRRIPKGKTLTYKEVAQRAGRPRAYRAVGNILNKNRDFSAKGGSASGGKNMPCHRVIRSDGKIGGYVLGKKKKVKLLKKEGLDFS